jgi:hypothetical protein
MRQQHADPPFPLRLLRTRCKQPADRAAEKCD